MNDKVNPPVGGDSINPTPTAPATAADPLGKHAAADPAPAAASTPLANEGSALEAIKTAAANTERELADKDFVSPVAQFKVNEPILGTALEVGQLILFVNAVYKVTKIPNVVATKGDKDDIDVPGSCILHNGNTAQKTIQLWPDRGYPVVEGNVPVGDAGYSGVVKGSVSSGTMIARDTSGQPVNG